MKANIVKKINKVFDELSIPHLEPEALQEKIDNLTSNAYIALVEAIKEKKVNVIIGVLELDRIIYMKDKKGKMED